MLTYFLLSIKYFAKIFIKGVLMSLIISIYVNEGIVMASDSRLTITTHKGQIPYSDTNQKTFLCPNKCGISVCGNASYNNQPIGGYIENFIHSHTTDKTKISEMPSLLLNYFNSIDPTRQSMFHICGYEEVDGKYNKMIYKVETGPNPNIIHLNQGSTSGACWDGEILTLSKILKSQILTPRYYNVPNINITLTDGSLVTIPDSAVLDKSQNSILPDIEIAWDAMTLQDAIDFAKYALEITIKTMKFTLTSNTVGGPIEILVIKPKESKWLQHKKLNVKD